MNLYSKCVSDYTRESEEDVKLASNQSISIAVDIDEIVMYMIKAVRRHACFELIYTPCKKII